MEGDLKRFAVACWQSRLGRTLFFVHLMFGMLIVGYCWNHVLAGSPFRSSYFEWWLFSLNWPSVLLFSPIIFLINLSGPSQLGDALIITLISLHWWFYGIFAERFAKLIRPSQNNA